MSEIRTQQTFTQGLVEILASYYVNIYSPYDAEFLCDSVVVADVTPPHPEEIPTTDSAD